MAWSQGDEIAGKDMFTPEHYTKLLQQMQSNLTVEQLDALEDLCTTLAYGDRNLLSNFPMEKCCSTLVDLLENSDNWAVRRYAVRGIFSCLEGSPRSTPALMCTSFLNTMANYLVNIEDIETAQNCLSAIACLSHYRPADIGKSIGIAPLINNVGFFSTPDQRSAIKACVRITNVYVEPDFIMQVPELLENLSNHLTDEIIVDQSAVVIRNIFKANMDQCYVTPEIIQNISKIASTTQKSTIQAQFFSIIYDFSFQENFIAAIINAKIDFNAVFSSDNSKSQSQDFFITVFKIISNLLPTDEKLKTTYGVNRVKRPEESTQFAKDIQPFIITVLTQRPMCVYQAILTLTQTCLVQVPQIDQSLITALASAVQDNKCLEIIIYFATLTSDNALIQTNILPIIKSKSKQRFRTGIKTLVNRLGSKVKAGTSEPKKLSESSITEISALCRNKSINQIDLLSNEVITHIISLVNELDDNNDEDLSSIAAYYTQLLDMQNIFPSIKFLNLGDLLLSRFAGWVNIVFSDDDVGTSSMRLPHQFKLYRVEQVVNSIRGSLSQKILTNAALKNPSITELASYIKLGEPNSAETCVYARALISSYWRTHYVAPNGMKFSVQETVWDMLAACGVNGNFTVPLKCGYGEAPLTLRVPKSEFLKNTQLRLVQLLELLKSKGASNVECKGMSASARSMLADAGTVFGRTSPAMAMIYNHPLLFPFHTRLIAFRLASFDLISAMHVMKREFKPVLSSPIPHEDILKVSVHRDRVFEDGSLLLQGLLRNRMKIEATFIGEEGIGFGPTHEFFTLYSHESAKNIRKMWLTDAPGSEYASWKGGLFPSPRMKIEDFTNLGTFIAKAITMESLVDLDISPAFFKLTLGEDVTIQEIDPSLANSLKQPEGLVGLPFTFPGMDDVELVEGGADRFATEEDCGELAKAIENALLNAGKRAAEAFVFGFSQVIPFNSLSVFRPDEMPRVIAGDAPAFTLEELYTYVDATNGYTKDSPQIKMLFKIMVGLSPEEQRQLLMFLTGYQRLPIGGLAALDPRLVIVKKSPGGSGSPKSSADDLPSVMTCTNYFKLPPYSSEDVMKEKLMQAVHEGLGAFLMT